MKLRFIVNARSGRAARALPEVRAYAARHGATLVLTERPRHAGELATRALGESCDVVAAVGGDGTMNEVASALIGTGATLGLVPCGSGDGLGRCLGIHGSIAHALAILSTGSPRLIDTATADGHPFFTAAGIGFEAEIARRFNTLQRRGFARYLSTSARLFREWQPERYRVTGDGGSEVIEAFTLCVANANQYGNDARIAPAARVDDGTLDLTAIPPVNWLSAAPLGVRLFRGNIAGARGVVCRRGARFVVERTASGWLHTDGELHEAGRLIEFQVRPATLRVLCAA